MFCVEVNNMLDPEVFVLKRLEKEEPLTRLLIWWLTGYFKDSIAISLQILSHDVYNLPVY